MFAAALIVFREVLEAALVVSIVMAATRDMPRRAFWVGLGIGGGVVSAGIIAALAGTIASAFEGAGQEIVNAIILFAAVLLITWHVVWMSSHGREIAAHMYSVGKNVAEGNRHMSVLAIVVGLAVMREGAEVVLILQGLASAGDLAGMMGGGALGLLAGIMAGALMYFGLLALPVHKVFTLTNSLLVLIAAGMAAHGANFLSQAGLPPPLGSRLWDTSAVISDQSAVGQLLAALVGYIARPSGIEVLSYALTVVFIAGLAAGMRHHLMNAKRAAAIVTLSLLGLLPQAAKADEVFSPYIEEGEWEFETEGVTSHDRDPANNDGLTVENAIGYSPTAFYHTELEGEFERDPGPGEDLRYGSINWLNTVALAAPGKYWIDPAAFFELDLGDGKGANTAIFGLIAAKEIGRVVTTFNFFAHRQFASDDADTKTGFIYSNQTRYLARPWFEPGFEVYGDTDGKGIFDDQQLAIGPGIFGALPGFGGGQHFGYEVAYLRGVTAATPDWALRWKLEYEIHF